MADDERGPRARYLELRDRHAAAAEAGRAADEALTRRRVLVFLAGFACLVLATSLHGWAAAACAALAAGALAGFVALVAAHRRVVRTIRHDERLRALAEAGLHRLDRRWELLEPPALPTEPGFAEPLAEHPYAADLHVLGGGFSLQALCGPVTTEAGRRTLAGWLLAPAGPDAIAARQAAVRELAPEVSFRHALAAAGRASPSEQGTGTFLSWAEEAPWMERRGWVTAASWILPASLIALVVAYFAGLGPWLFVPFALELVVQRRLGARVRADFERAAHGGLGPGARLAQLELVAERRPSAALLVELARRVGADEADARAGLTRLARMVDWIDSRANPLYEAAAVLLLLDLHVHRALDRWRARYGGRVRGWLDALGEWEALAALAALAFDHPDWTFPVIHDEPRVEARALGHPLLPPERCVRNDVEVGPPGTLLLVTGSNMAGKSTLIRAIGVNAVLAAAGGPVCAASLRLPPLRVFTSMRQDDSLEQGVSRFMGELLAIRRILDAATAADDPRPVLYLLDEILQGTNSEERSVAARGVLRRLLATRAIGAVTTHDLKLASAPDLTARSQVCHFRETVVHEDGAARLDFDYRLRPGPATSRNALQLMELMGLGPVGE